MAKVYVAKQADLTALATRVTDVEGGAVTPEVVITGPSEPAPDPAQFAEDSLWVKVISGG